MKDVSYVLSCVGLFATWWALGSWWNKATKKSKRDWDPRKYERKYKP